MYNIIRLTRHRILISMLNQIIDLTLRKQAVPPSANQILSLSTVWFPSNKQKNLIGHSEYATVISGKQYYMTIFLTVKIFCRRSQWR